MLATPQPPLSSSSPSSPPPPAPPSPASGARGAIPGWLFPVMLGLMLLSTVLPFVGTPYPGQGDYLNHLARLYLTTESAPAAWALHYTFVPGWVPNLGSDLVGGWLVQHGWSPDRAMWLFSLGAALLCASGVVALSAAWQAPDAAAPSPHPNAAHPPPCTWPWLALWAFPLVLGRYYAWGFLNYFFALGLGFWAMAAWLAAYRVRPLWARALLGAVAQAGLLAAMFCHLMGWGVAVAGLGLWLLARQHQAAALAGGWRALGWAAQVRWLAQGLALVGPGGWVYLRLFRHSIHGGTLYEGVLASKLAGLVAPFLAFSALGAALTLGLLLLVLLWLARGGGLRGGALRGFVSQPTRLWPAAGVTLLFLVLPSSLMGSWFLDRRLFTAALLLALAAVPMWRVPPRAVWALCAALLLAQGVRVFELRQAWQAHSQIIGQLRPTLAQVPLGGTLVGLNFSDSQSLEPPVLVSAANLAVADRAAYVPSLFVEPRDRMPIMYRSLSKLRASTQATAGLGGTMSPASAATLDWPRLCAFADHLLLTWTVTAPFSNTTATTTTAAPPPPCLRPVASGPHFTLYATPLAPVAAPGAAPSVAATRP